MNLASDGATFHTGVVVADHNLLGISPSMAGLGITPRAICATQWYAWTSQ